VESFFALVGKWRAAIIENQECTTLLKYRRPDPAYPCYKILFKIGKEIRRSRFG